MSPTTPSNQTKIYISVAIIIILVISIWVFAINNKSTNNLVNNSTKPDVTIKQDNKMVKNEKTYWTSQEMAMMKDTNISGDKMMQNNSVIKQDNKIMIAKTGGYTDYSTENIAKNFTGTNVIFFHAAWCSICKSVEADIKTNIDKIPQNLQILKLDYDSSLALRQKYGVTTQHTFVKIDKDGNKLAINQALFTLDEIIDFAK